MIVNRQPWKVLDSEIVFDHPWYKLRQDRVQLPNGRIIDDYVVEEKKDIVFIFPVTADHKVVLVNQYKHGCREFLLEIPGGVFDPAHEQPEAAAKRELMEETGFRAEALIPLGMVYDDPSKDTSKTYLYLAENVEKTGEQQLDITEDIEIILADIREIYPKIINGEIRVCNSISGIFYALDHLGYIQHSGVKTNWNDQ